MYAEAFGSRQRLVHELAHGADGAHRRLLRVGQYAGQEAGDALAGKEAGQLGQLLVIGGVDVHTVSAVGMYVYEARREYVSLEVEDLTALPRKAVAYGGDALVHDEDFGVHQFTARKNGSAREYRAPHVRTGERWPWRWQKSPRPGGSAAGSRGKPR